MGQIVIPAKKKVVLQKAGDTVDAPGVGYSGGKTTKKKHGFLHSIYKAATSNYNPIALDAKIGVNLLKDIKTAAPAIPQGVGAILGASAYDISHPSAEHHFTRDIIGGMGKQYKEYYTGQERDPKTGKLHKGGIGGVFHNLATHPLQPILDVMTVLTLGGAGAAKLGEAGYLGERSVEIGKAGTRKFTVNAPEAAGGTRDVLLPTSKNPYTRSMQNLRHTLMRRSVASIESKLGRDTRFNEHATGVRIEQKLGRRGESTQLRRDLHPFDTAMRGLSSVEEVALSMRTQGLAPAEYRAYVAKQLEDAQAAIQSPEISDLSRRSLQQTIKAHERMLQWTEKVTPELYDSVLTDPKLAKAHAAAQTLMDTAAETGVNFNLLRPEDVANRPFLAVRVMRGAQYTPLEEVAQQTLEASKSRAAIHAEVDKVATDPLVADEIKQTMDENARWYSQYRSSTPEAAAKSADHFYDTLQFHALPGEIPNTMWENMPERLMQAAKHADTSKEGVIEGIWGEVQRLQAESKKALSTDHNAIVPPDMLTREGVAARVDKLIKQALEGEAAKAWYTHSGQDILKATDGDLPAARKIAQLVAMTSPQQMVLNNVKSSIEFWNAYKTMGDKAFAKAVEDGSLKVSGLITRDQYGKALEILRGKGPHEVKYLGQKTHSFYRNFLQEFDPATFNKLYPGEDAARGPVTFDTWMRRALEYPRRLLPEKTKMIPVSKMNWKAKLLLAREDPALFARVEAGKVKEVPINKYAEPIGEKAYLFGEHVVSAVADMLGWKPHEAQAAIWTAIKNDWEGTTGVGGEFHIGTAFDRLADEGVKPLLQKHPYNETARGLYTPGTESAPAQIHLGTSADIDTVIHELGHHVAALMKGETYEATFAKKMGATKIKGGDYVWSREAEEAFANAYLSWAHEQPGKLGDALRKMYPEEGELPTLKPSVRKAFDKMHSPKKLKGAILHGGPSVEELASMEGLIAHPHIGEVLPEGAKPQAASGLGAVKKPGLAKWNKGWRLANSQWIPGPAAFRNSYVRTMAYTAAVKRGEYAFSIGKPLEDVGAKTPNSYLVKEPKAKVLRSEKEAPALEEAYNQFEKADGGDVEKLINRQVATDDTKVAEEWQKEGYRIREISPADYKAIFGEFKQTNKMVKRFFDTPTDAWRTLTLTYRPAWVVNNIVGQTLLFAINHAGKGSLKAYAQAATESIRRDSSLVDELQGGFVRTEAPSVKAVTGTGGTAGRRAWRQFWRGEHRVRDAIQRFNSEVSDNVPRNATYKAIVNRMQKTDDLARQLNEHITSTRGDTSGLTGEMKRLNDEIVQEVLDTLIDFGNLDHFERTYIRRAVPFYSWIKGITKATGKLGFEHPGRAIILLWLAELGEQDAQRNFGEGRASLPGFVPFGPAKNGIVGGLATTGLNPWATVGQVAGAATGGTTNSNDPADNPFLQFNPFVQALVTAAAGTDLYSRKPIPGGRGDIFLSELLGAPPQASLVRDLLHPKIGSKKLTRQQRSDLLLRYLGIPVTHKNVNTAKSLQTKPIGR